MDTFDRRKFMAVCSSIGLTSTLFPGVLWGMAQEGSSPATTPGPQPSPSPSPKKITAEMIAGAAAIAGVSIEDSQKQLMLSLLNDQLKAYEKIRELHLPNDVQMALVFNPVLPGMTFERQPRPMRLGRISVASAPRNLEDVAFASARELGELVRTRKVSSSALTDMYLERLKRYDPLLKYMITYTEDRAKAQAREADREIAAGKYRGPLHGLPWGAKDLLAVKGYPTTWGAAGFEHQQINQDATVVQRLDAAGAVLLGKTTLGALANDDVWFGGKTRNPWNPAEGSSGSSAGSASATAAGCIAFSIGSETLGSISSPCTRCGTTGLRPTFGFIPRTGAMALSWSMDKLGPICRSVEDCALVMDAIYGPDGHDRCVRDAAFNWDANLDWRKLRVGYLKTEFEKPPEAEPEAKEQKDISPEEKAKKEEDRQRRADQRARRAYDRRYDEAAIAKLRSMGASLAPVELPKYPYDAMVNMLLAESAAAFDELTRTGRV